MKKFGETAFQVIAAILVIGAVAMLFTGSGGTVIEWIKQFGMWCSGILNSFVTAVQG